MDGSVSADARLKWKIRKDKKIRNFREVKKLRFLLLLYRRIIYILLLYECTPWTLTKRMEKKLDGNYARMLRAVLNKTWTQHPTKQQLYGYLTSTRKTIQVRTRLAGHCWRKKNELISDILLWTPSYGRAKVGRPTRTLYTADLC